MRTSAGSRRGSTRAPAVRTASARTVGGNPGRRPAPRRGAATARAIGGVLSVLLLAGSGWGWYLSQVAEASVNRTDAIPTSGNNDTSHDGSAMNLLLVGDDSRSDLSKAQMDQLNAGDDGGSQNTDTMILVHVPADGSKASFVSFPRDSYVQIPGHGWDKLNAAYADGCRRRAEERRRPTSAPRPASGCSCRPSASSPACRSTTSHRWTCSASST